MEIKEKMFSFPRRFCRGVVHKGTANVSRLIMTKAYSL
jgi:hypothetical protein